MGLHSRLLRRAGLRHISASFSLFIIFKAGKAEFHECLISDQTAALVTPF